MRNKWQQSWYGNITLLICKRNYKPSGLSLPMCVTCSHTCGRRYMPLVNWFVSCSQGIIFVIGRFLLYDENTYLERFPHLWKEVNITTGFCLWNMVVCTRKSLILIATWAYGLPRSDQRMHAKIFLLLTWMQMMTVLFSWAAWQSVTQLILYATVSWTLVLGEVSSDEGPVVKTSNSTAVPV